ncbi:ABC transporter permease [Sphingomonas sp.]
MSPIGIIARDELRQLARNRVAVVGALLIVLLTAIAALTSASNAAATADLRARYQQSSDEAFASQPDRHPHRVVHYGHFVFRPLGALAAFDPGVDPYTGNAMFLEGHRQNSANFGDVRQSSLLIRFGQLTPAFVLQVLVPLLLVFLGYGAVVRERERGTLRQLLLQGVGPGQLIAGKAVGIGIAATALALPALLALGFIATTTATAIGPVAVMAAGYVAYLLVWAMIVLIVSTLARRMRDSLIVLVGLWALSVVLLPRAASDFASLATPLPTRIESEIATAQQLRALGDSHNPDDPFFARFKATTLARYGVERVEDLPVNYAGLVAVEGERLTSELFARAGAEAFATQASQSALADAAILLSPTVAVRRLSMAAAGTDLDGHRRFLDQAEAYRYAFVQRLNQLQADKVDAALDKAKGKTAAAERAARISSANFAAIPRFTFLPAKPSELVRAALPALTALIAWALVLAGILTFAARQLSRKTA